MLALLRSEGLPSALEPVLLAVDETIEPGQMTAADVSQWGSEQLRDVRRLAKHLQDVRDTVQPLQSRLQAAEAERDALGARLERAQEEFQQTTEKLHADIVQLEFSLRNAHRSLEEAEQRLLVEQQQLQRGGKVHRDPRRGGHVTN